MSSPDHIKIVAIIPHPDKSDVCVRDSEGEYPSVIHEHGKRTYEETFQELGRRVTGQYVSISRRAYEQEERPGNNMAYEAKPVAAEFGPESDYQWREA